MKKSYIFIAMMLFFSLPSRAQQRLSLDDCISIALEKNTQLLNATSDLAIAKANKLNSYAYILPNIGISGGPGRTFQAPSVYEANGPIGLDTEGKVIYGKTVQYRRANTTIRYGAQAYLSQTLWDNGRWWNAIRQGETGVRSSEYSLRNTVVTTVLTVIERYYSLVKVLKQRAVLEESVAAAAEQLKNSQSMYEIGTVAQVDVYKSRVTLGQRRISLINHDLRIEENRNQLNIAMGRDIGEPLDIEMDVPLNVDYAVSLENLTSHGLQSHPRLLQLQENITGSILGVNIAKSARYPRLSYSASYYRTNSDVERIYKNLSYNYYLSLNLNFDLNVFDGFQTRANIQRAQSTLRINERNLDDARRAIQSSIKNYYLQLKSYKDQIEINKEIVASAEEDVRLANERYRVGSGTLIESINAQANLTSAHFMLVQMQYDAKIAEARLHAAVGSLGEKYSYSGGGGK